MTLSAKQLSNAARRRERLIKICETLPEGQLLVELTVGVTADVQTLGERMQNAMLALRQLLYASLENSLR